MLQCDPRNRSTYHSGQLKVTQRFQNPSQGWVEGTYVFPLPENSAVDALKMQIGERFIEGQLKPHLLQAAAQAAGSARRGQPSAHHNRAR